MKSSNAIAYSVVVLLLACSGSSGGGTTPLSPTVNGGNVLPIMVFWGSVQIADVILVNESEVIAHIQIVDSTFISADIPCTTGMHNGKTLASTPSDVGLNGIPIGNTEAFCDSSSNKVFDDIEALANHHCDRALSSSVGELPPVHSRGSVVPLGSSEIDRTAIHIMVGTTIQPAGAWLLESSCALEWM